MVDEVAKRGLIIGFDDYLVTHGSAERAAVGSKMIRDAPEIAGQFLRQRCDTVRAGQKYPLKELRRENIVTAKAYSLKEGRIDAEGSMDLVALSHSNRETWQATNGDWYVSIVYTETQPYGVMNPLYAQKVIEYYFEPFEKHSHGQMGKAVNYFFQDELIFGGSMPYWSPDFSVRFLKMKGYDIVPELSALFTHLGDRTVKIRLDYYDVATQLMEDAYFIPIYDWCQSRGVIYGHDQASRADVIDGVRYYGDYFRALRWYQAPGTDRMPILSRGKVVSSISHLYNRPRTWFEAYHSQGWGVTPAQITEWDYAALIYGYNLFSYHSCYYTTLGGWWEWAPGDITFRQPYWSYFSDHYQELKRLSYLLSQGKHQCDVVVLFPTSTIQADMNGPIPGQYAQEAKKTMNFTEPLFKEHSIDFIFIDDELMARAKAKDGTLLITGASYKIVILPAVRFIRHATLDKLFQFYQQGGKVIALGALPEASDRKGSSDSDLNVKVKTIFGKNAMEARTDASESLLNWNSNNGAGYFLKDPNSVSSLVGFISKSIKRDFNCNGAGIHVMHRKEGGRDIFALYNPKPKSVEAKLDFNLTDRRAEEWDARSGDIRSLLASRLLDQGMRLEILFHANEFKIVVFREGPPELKGNVGKPVMATSERLILDDEWEFKIEPVMDNRWGDFRSPASDELMGVETRRFRYHEEHSLDDSHDWSNPKFDDGAWGEAVASYGPRLWTLGPIQPNTELRAFEAELKTLKQVDATVPVYLGEDTLYWQPVQHSLRWGIYNDPALTHQTGLAIHGPIGYVPDEMLHFKAQDDGDIWYVWTSVKSTEGKTTKLAAGTRAGYQVWFNGKEILQKNTVEAEIRVQPWRLRIYSYETNVTTVSLRKGGNPVLIKLSSAEKSTWIRLYLAVHDSLEASPEPPIEKHSAGDPAFVPNALVASDAYVNGRFSEFDCYPQNRPAGLWYRFIAPPGMRSMTITAHGKLRVWIDGRQVPAKKVKETTGIANLYEQADTYIVTPDQPILTSSLAAIRITPNEGFYGGAALPEPIRYSCASGIGRLRDWSVFGLECYPGAVRYTQTVSIDRYQADRHALLDLGDVASAAKIWVNGKLAGSCYRPPWQIDISGLLQAGENKLKISVANTLANHYSIGMPGGRRYVFTGQERSGLFGPVVIHFMTEKR